MCRDDVVELSLHTNSKIILRHVINLSKKNFTRVIDYYKKLESFNFAQELKDILVEDFILHYLKEENLFLEKIVNYSNFKKIASFSENKLRKFLTLLNHIKVQNIFCLEDVYSFSCEDMLALAKLADTTDIIYQEIIKAAVSSLTVDSLKKLLDKIIHVQFFEKRDIAIDIFSRSYVYTHCLDTYNRIIQLITSNKIGKEEKDSLKRIYENGELFKVAELKDICDYMEYAIINEGRTVVLKNYDIVDLLNSNRSIHDLIRIENTLKVNPQLTNFLCSTILSKAMSLDEQLAIINTININSYDKCAMITKIACDFLDKYEHDLNKKAIFYEYIVANFRAYITDYEKGCYTTTVDDYIEACDGIKEFLRVIENSDIEDDFNKQTTLSLK